MFFVVLLPIVMVVGLIYMARDKNAISELGLSSEGVHFKFSKKEASPIKETAEFVAWDDIKEMAPHLRTSLTLRIGEEKKELHWSDIDNTFLLKRFQTKIEIFR